MPFVPMGPQAPLATPEDHARMAAVLAKHAKPKVEVSREVQLEWLPKVPGRAWLETKCLRYTLTACKVDGEYVYTAFRRAEPQAVNLGSNVNADIARAFAHADAN